MLTKGLKLFYLSQLNKNMSLSYLAHKVDMPRIDAVLSLHVRVTIYTYGPVGLALFILHKTHMCIIINSC